MTEHGALEADFRPGSMVGYRPYGIGSRVEHGIVVRANDAYVFVRFERGKPSKAVAPDLLEVLIDPIPDPRIQMMSDLIDSWRDEAVTDPGVGMLSDAMTDVLVGAVDESSEEPT